jgi:hypothetical protein
MVDMGRASSFAPSHHPDPDLLLDPSDKAVSLRYSIDRRDANAAIICTLVAHDYAKNVVGQIDDSFLAGAAHVERTTLIPTRSAAVSGSISRCRPSSQ